MKSSNYIIVSIILLSILSCKSTLKSVTPTMDLPEKYMFDTLASYNIYEGKWWSMFGDPILDSLEETALRTNKNLQQTILAVEQSRLTAKNVRSNMFPSVDLAASAGVKYDKESGKNWSYNVAPAVSWDLDIFGKLRNLSRASMNSYIASEWGARGVRLALTAEVATTYFALLAYHKNYQIALQTYTLRNKSLSMIDSMYHYGAVSLVDLEQARSSTLQAEAATFNYKNAVIKTSISLNTLLGRNHEEIEIGDIYKIIHNISIPVGMPSLLLERRPDIMQAFYEYNAAVSQMKAAKAARLPSFSLTGSGGILSDFATSLTSGKPFVWSASLSLLQPIINWKTNINNVKISKTEMQSALLGYEQSVISAVGEVETALSAIENGTKELRTSRNIVNSTTISQNLTGELYIKGMSAYLDVLDADRSLLTSQTDYITTLENLLNSYVSLFQAIGGGFPIEK